MTDAYDPHQYTVHGPDGQPVNRPVWVLDAAHPLSAPTLRQLAAAALAGQVNGDWVEQVYEAADAMDAWAAEHGTQPLPDAPVELA